MMLINLPHPSSGIAYPLKQIYSGTTLSNKIIVALSPQTKSTVALPPKTQSIVALPPQTTSIVALPPQTKSIVALIPIGFGCYAVSA